MKDPDPDGRRSSYQTDQQVNYEPHSFQPMAPVTTDDIVHGTKPDVPVVCFRPQALQTAAQWFLRNFPGKVLYAVKANPSPEVLQGLYAAGIRDFDAASAAEVELVRQHCPGAHIGFMHPVKSRHAIEQAYFDHGVRDFSFDSMEELEKIVTVTGKSQDLTLLLRLAVPNVSAAQPLTGKFGALPAKAPELLKAARKVAKRLGICFHVGSQTTDPEAYPMALQVVADIQRAIPRTKIDIVDIGGGFPSAYADTNLPPMSAFAEAVMRGITLLQHPEKIEFWCEPGRAMVAECAATIVKVELRKGDNLYINDGTYGSLFDAGHFGLRYPVRLIRPVSATPSVKKPSTKLKGFSFYGPTCDSIDFMAGPFVLPDDVREGDYIEIGQLGAYGNALRTGFNGFHAFETATVDTPPLLTMYPDTEEVLSGIDKNLCVA